MEDNAVEVESAESELNKIKFLLPNEANIFGRQDEARWFLILRIVDEQTIPRLLAVENTDERPVALMSQEEAEEVAQPFALEAFEEFRWSGRKEPTLYFKLEHWMNSYQVRWQRVLDMLNLNDENLSAMFNQPVDAHNLTAEQLHEIMLRYMGV